jgi:hypothetical protein
MRIQLALLLAVAGCVEPVQGVSKTIDSSGGSLALKTDAKIDIGAGALASATKISIDPSNETPPSTLATDVGGTWLFGPEGQTFSQPVTITLAVDTSKLPKDRTIDNVSIITAPKGSGSFVQLDTKVVDPSHVSATTTHFSRFVPVVDFAVTDVALDKPVANAGFQLEVPAFDVPAGTEIQACYFFNIPGTGDVWVDNYQVAQTSGSHHMNIFRVASAKPLQPNPDGTPVVNGECFNSSNWSDWPLVVNSQHQATVSWQLPDGVGAKFQGGDLIMLQTHYVNATTQKTPAKGKVLVNFNFPTATPQHELSTLFATNQNIRICPGESDKSFSKTCQFPATGVHVIAANGHFHSRGTLFQIMPTDAQGVTGDVFYTSTSWDDPPMTRDIDVVLPDNGGVEWKCTFSAPVGSCGNPADSCCFTFGGHVDTQEHCNAFVYYWGATIDPKSINCF